jgi:GNAT superfamily N-acetyltransferase
VLHGAYAQQPLDDGAPLLHYVALRDGRPIASATTFLGAGVAGVWHVGVLESERRRGIGAAITLAGLYDARDRGYRVSTLYASAMGYPVYKRLGYIDCNRMLQYVKEAPA